MIPYEPLEEHPSAVFPSAQTMCSVMVVVLQLHYTGGLHIALFHQCLLDPSYQGIPNPAKCNVIIITIIIM